MMLRLRRHGFLLLSILLWVGLGALLLLRLVSSANGQDADRFPEETAAEASIATDWSDYRFPIDVPYDKTSTFGEFRSTHFHEGIDIGTQGRNGFPVRATRSGWVERATMDPGGYGWKLVLRHADGFSSVYAHLERFSDRIGAAYAKQLVALGKSCGEVRFDSGAVQVMQGDMIARSGDTGAGGPHLHFEILDSRGHPVNPELAPRLRCKDGITPVIKEIVFTPMDGESTVNGSPDPLHLRAIGTPESGYVLSDTPVVRGRVGMVVRALDGRESSPFVWTPYSLILRVDGKSDFVAISHRLYKGQAWLIHVDREYQLSAKHQEYRKLYRDPGNPLPMYTERDPLGGIFSEARWGAGTHRFEVHARDLARNGSRLRGCIEIAPDVRLTWNRSSQGIHLDAVASTEATVRLSSVTTEGRWVERARYTVSSGASRRDLSTSEWEGTPVLKAEVLGPRQQNSAPVYLHLASRLVSPPRWKREIVFNEIRYRIEYDRPPDHAPRIVLQTGTEQREASVWAETPTRYRAVLIAPASLAGQATVRMHSRFGGVDAWSEDHLRMFLIDPHVGGVASSEDGRFEVRCGPGVVYRPMLLTIDSREVEGKKGYAVSPSEIPLVGAPEQRLRDRSVDRTMYLKGIPRMGAWRNEIPPVDERMHDGLVARMGRLLRTYVVAQDSQGPRISVVARKRSRDLVVRISDAETAVNLESVVIRVNGAVVAPEILEGNPLQFVLRNVVVPGAAPPRVQVTAHDVVGNVSRLP